MGFTVAKLPSNAEGQRLRAFRVKQSALRDGARIALRASMIPLDASTASGIHFDSLSFAGIVEGRIDIRRLREYLARAIELDASFGPALRDGEERTVDNLLRAIVGRLGKEEEALEVNIVAALKRADKPEGEVLLAAYLEDLFTEGKNPYQQGKIASAISHAVYSDPIEADVFFRAVAKRLTVDLSRDLNYRAGLIAGAAGINVDFAASAVKQLCPDEGSIGKLIALTAQKGRGERESQAHFAAAIIANLVTLGEGQAKELAVEVIKELAADEASKPIIAAILCSVLAGSREVDFAVGITAKLGLNAEASRGKFMAAMAKKLYANLADQINYIADAAKLSSSSLDSQAKFAAAGIRELTGDIKEPDKAVRAQMPLAWSAAQRLCLSQAMPESAEFLAAVIMDLYHLDKLSQAEAVMVFIAEAKLPLETAIDFLNIVAERTGIAPETLIGRLA